MRTINFGKNLRLSQIKPIKTAEFKFYQFGKKKVKILHPVCKNSRVILAELISQIWGESLFSVNDTQI